MSKLEDLAKKGVAALERDDVETAQSICFEMIDDTGNELFKELRADVVKRYAGRSRDFCTLKALLELADVRVEMRFLTGAAARAQLQRRVEAVEQLALDELAELQRRVEALEKTK